MPNGMEKENLSGRSKSRKKAWKKFGVVKALSSHHLRVTLARTFIGALQSHEKIINGRKCKEENVLYSYYDEEIFCHRMNAHSEEAEHADEGKRVPRHEV